jgi:Domain of unknown function (DUF6316)
MEPIIAVRDRFYNETTAFVASAKTLPIIVESRFGGTLVGRWYRKKLAGFVSRVLHPSTTLTHHPHAASGSMLCIHWTGRKDMRVEDPRESNKRYFRASKRVISLNGAWYFTTREGERGPFSSPEEADLQLRRFKVEMSELQAFQKSRAARNERQSQTLEQARELTAKLRAARARPSAPLTLQQVLV